MSSFFLTCAILGAAVLVIQLAVGLLGFGGDGHDGHHVHVGEGLHAGLDLLSMRALAAGVAGFGIGGLLTLRAGLGPVIGLAAGIALGLALAYGVARIMRSMLRLESDGTIRLHDAVGTTARVYLGVPPARQGTGKIHLVLQGRTVELQAVTSHGEPLRTGAAVVVLDVVSDDVVEVAPEAVILPPEVSSHAAP